MDPVDLARPLRVREPWTDPPDDLARALEPDLRRALDALEAGAPEARQELARLRTRVYAAAASSFGDRWWVTRVAELEEWTAEQHRRDGALELAFLSWRGGWWIRRELGEPVARDHADRVLAALAAATGRRA